MNEVEVFYPTIYPNDVADVNIGPTISPAKRRRIDGPRTQTMFTSSRRQKRNVGKLEIVFNLPTDIFYEVLNNFTLGRLSTETDFRYAHT